MNLFYGSIARPMKSLRTSDNGSLNNLRSRGSEEHGCPDSTISPIDHRDPSWLLPYGTTNNHTADHLLARIHRLQVKPLAVSRNRSPENIAAKLDEGGSRHRRAT
jgi:hypothetical protein